MLTLTMSYITILIEKLFYVNNILAFFNIFNHDLLILVTLKLYNTVFFINSTVLKFYFITVLVILLDP